MERGTGGKANSAHASVTRMSQHGCVGCDEHAAVMSRCHRGTLRGPEAHRDPALCCSCCQSEIFSKPKLYLTTALACEKALA